jgi:hypothetical protein
LVGEAINPIAAPETAPHRPHLTGALLTSSMESICQSWSVHCHRGNQQTPRGLSSIGEFDLAKLVSIVRSRTEPARSSTSTDFP